MTAVAIPSTFPAKDYLVLWCPGCEDDHEIVTRSDHGNGPVWQWDGDTEKPTVSPSILSRYPIPHSGPPNEFRVCHSFVRDGVWEFLSDSTHALAGQHVPLTRGPHWPKEANDAE